MSREVSASEFKAKCLGLLDEVAEKGETIVVTKRGRPVARVLPVEAPASLRGSVEYLVDEEELVEPVLGRWDLESE